MSTNYAFIGAGNMAKAMIGGILSSGLAAPDCVTASNPSAPKLDALKEEFGIRTGYHLRVDIRLGSVDLADVLNVGRAGLFIDIKGAGAMSDNGLCD